jgi:hypothetical protein
MPIFKNNETNHNPFIIHTISTSHPAAVSLLAAYHLSLFLAANAGLKPSDPCVVWTVDPVMKVKYKIQLESSIHTITYSSVASKRVRLFVCKP